MKALVLVLVALLLAVISVGGWMLARPNPLNDEIVRLERELKTVRVESAKLKTELEAQKKQASKRELASAAATPLSQGKPDGTAAPSDGKPGDKTAAGGKEEGMSGFMSMARKMMDNPAMKEMMKQQSLARTETRYAGLFETFKLTPEEKENFKQLIAARSAISTEMGTKMLDKNLTTEQRKKISDEMDAAKKASDEAIKTFLGNDKDYKTFQHWEDTSIERTQLDTLGGRAFFTSSGEPLTPAQESKLIDVMYTIRKSSYKQPRATKLPSSPDGMFSDEYIQQQLQKMDREAESVRQNAAGFLSAVQLDALDKMQKQRRSTTEASLKMTSTMMKNMK